MKEQLSMNEIKYQKIENNLRRHGYQLINREKFDELGTMLEMYTDTERKTHIDISRDNAGKMAITVWKVHDMQNIIADDTGIFDEDGNPMLIW